MCVECEKNGSKIEDGTVRPCVEVGLALLGLFRVMDAEDFAVDLEKHSRTLSRKKKRIRIHFLFFLKKGRGNILIFWKKKMNFCRVLLTSVVEVTQDGVIGVRHRHSQVTAVFLFFFIKIPWKGFPNEMSFLVSYNHLMEWIKRRLTAPGVSLTCTYVSPYWAPRCLIHSLFTKREREKTSGITRRMTMITSSSIWIRLTFFFSF